MWLSWHPDGEAIFDFLGGSNAITRKSEGGRWNVRIRGGMKKKKARCGRKGTFKNHITFSLRGKFKYYLYAFSRRRQWQPTPVLLPGKSHGQRSLEGCSPWGCWGLDTTERLRFHFHALEKEMQPTPVPSKSVPLCIRYYVWKPFTIIIMQVRNLGDSYLLLHSIPCSKLPKHGAERYIWSMSPAIQLVSCIR